MTQRIEIVEKAQHADPVPSNLVKQVNKAADQIDEKPFAPQIKKQSTSLSKTLLCIYIHIPYSELLMFRLEPLITEAEIDAGWKRQAQK